MSFGSDSLFTAFGGDGWSANSTKAPTVEDAYKVVPGGDKNQQMNDLLLENRRLKRLLNILQPPKENKDSETGPICQINFYHNSASRHHKDEVIRLVTEFLAEAEKDREMDTMDQLPRQRSAIHVPVRDDEESDDFSIIQSIQVFKDSYIVDKIGEPVGSKTNARDASWTIPEYTPLYKQLLGENPEEDKAKLEEARKKLSKCCFNCGSEDHGIAACPKPKDPKEINRRKEEFQKACGGTPRRNHGPNVRLFEASDYSTNKKFNAFKPGIVSAALRKALKLGDTEIPPWVYSMRNCGYPPGWLKEAEVMESGLVVKEDGEVNELNKIDISEEQEQTLTGLDASKIVEYPGFNSPLPDNCDDQPPKRIPKFSKTDNKHDFIQAYCRRNKIACIQKRKISNEEPDSGETDSKRVKLDDTDEDSQEFEVLDETQEEEEGFGKEFKPGWVAREEQTSTETSNKGLPSRNKWQDGITQFDYNAYQPAPAKQGTYSKLQTTLKK